MQRATLPPERTYSSRIDAWLLGLLLAAALAPLAAGIWVAATGRPGAALLLIWGVVTPVFVCLISLPMRYTLRATDLHIRSGLLEWTMPYARIRRVTLSRNPLSSPALSLRRVRIEGDGGDVILISPDDRESFMEEIARRCPHLVRRDTALESTA